jgi:hypothetical protein
MEHAQLCHMHTHTHTPSTSNITHTLGPSSGQIILWCILFAMGQTQNPKKKKLQSKLEVKCMGRISLQHLRFVVPKMEYQQPNTAKRLCKKRLKIGTNEQIQNSKKKLAVMAFGKKALGCVITISRHQL